MSVAETMTQVRGWPRADRRALLEALQRDLADEPLAPLVPGDYPVESPHDAFDAAAALQRMLAAERERS